MSFYTSAKEFITIIGPDGRPLVVPRNNAEKKTEDKSRLAKKVGAAAVHSTPVKQNLEKVETFNLGTGTGSSVLEVINAFEKVSNQKLNYQIVGRREGDVIEAYANTDKANAILGWKAQYSLEEALSSAWQWEQKIRNK